MLTLPISGLDWHYERDCGIFGPEGIVAQVIQPDDIRDPEYQRRAKMVAASPRMHDLLIRLCRAAALDSEQLSTFIQPLADEAAVIVAELVADDDD